MPITFPKVSNPLAKSIRTGEGILVYAFNLVLGIASILPGGLSWTHTALYATILNSVAFASRSLLKIVALQKGVGIDAPIDFNGPIDPAILKSVFDGEQQAAPELPPVVDAPSITSTSGKLETARTPDGGDANADGQVGAEVAPPAGATSITG